VDHLRELWQSECGVWLGLTLTATPPPSYTPTAKTLGDAGLTGHSGHKLGCLASTVRPCGPGRFLAVGLVSLKEKEIGPTAITVSLFSILLVYSLNLV
jgi:hypothetical protein